MMGYSSINDLKNTNILNSKFEKLNTGDIGYFNRDGLLSLKV